MADLTMFLNPSQSSPIDSSDFRWPFVYQKLRSIAAYLMHSERNDHTLSIEGLVHETYLRLFSGSMQIQNKEHFFRLFTRAMKRTLIDYARNRNALKRQGDKFQRSINEAFDVPAPTATQPEEELRDAVDRLAQIDERLGRVIELRFFQQLSIEEMARQLDVSTRTVDRDLKRAKLLLFHTLAAELSPHNNVASA